MGGNALKKIKPNRIKTNAVSQLKIDVIIALKKSKINFNNIGFPYSLKSKSDHGDLDVIIALNDINDYKNFEFQKAILNTFESKDWFFNSNVFSIEFQDYQIDLIFCEIKNFQSYIDYFSWNDLGNFIGRTANKMGFKYGEQGLLYEVILDNKKTKYVLNLSRDTEKILSFLGYDYSIWKRGFNSTLGIFAFTIMSKYFSGILFSDKEQTKSNEIRNKKRKNWISFVEYLYQTKLIEKEYKFEDNEYYLSNALKFFNKENELQFIIQEYEKEKERKQKFNGKIIMELLPLKEKELGNFIESFKKDKEFSIYLDSKNKEEVVNDIKEYYNSFMSSWK